MSWQQALLAAGLAIELVSLVYYIYTIRKGTTRPHPVSWLGWTVIGAIGAWATRSGGAGLGFYIAASFVVITFIVFVLSLLPGYEDGIDEKNPTDLPVLIVGIALLVLRISHIGIAHLNDPPVQASLAVLGDTCFVWFTVKKTLKYDTEPFLPWLGAIAASVIGVAVLGKYNYTTVVYPAYLVFADAAVTVASVVGKRRKRKRAGGR